MKWFQRKRIVVPFDFSEDSTQAVKVAISITDDLDDVHVVHVVAPLPANDPYVIWDDECDAKRQEHARKSLEQKLEDLPVDGIHVDIGLGKPGKVIVDLAEEIDAGLIIIPSHEKSGIARLLLGSVAEYVVRRAHCPVLVLKDS